MMYRSLLIVLALLLAAVPAPAQQATPPTLDDALVLVRGAYGDDMDNDDVYSYTPLRWMTCWQRRLNSSQM